MGTIDTVWLLPPWGKGEPQEFEATTAVLVPLMNQGWTQCDKPAKQEDESIVHG